MRNHFKVLLVGSAVGTVSACVACRMVEDAAIPPVNVPIAAPAPTTLPVPPSAPSIAVTIKGVRETDGALIISLFTGPDGFPDNPSKAYRLAAVPPSAPRFAFTDLPVGRYAVAVFQDRNGDGKLDKALIGFPTEPFGLSNQSSLSGGRPNFEKAALDVAGPAAVEVVLLTLGR